MEYDIIIIGAGIAGLTSAIYAKRAGKNVLIIESKIPGGQIVNAIGVENWPGETTISGADLSEKIHQQVAKLGVKTEYDEVLSVEKNSEKNFTVKTHDNEFTTKSVIIAVGAEPRKLSEKQTKDAGKRAISYCATCDGALYQDQPVVVVGSGNTAKHEISYLENIASKVYQIHHDDPIPEDAKAVFVAIGHVPATKAFKEIVDLDEKGYIIAGEDCISSCPGVFVAGDCRTKGVRQLVTAAADGAAATEAAIKYLD